ncbi:CBS domain-containing protein [Acidihalobacter prosperus]
MSVSQYCNRDAISIAADASALDAAKLMRKHRTGTLVVVSEQDGKRKPLGLLGESALVVEVMARSLDPKTATVDDLMQPVGDCAREDEAVWAVVERMRERNQRRLPVVDGEGAFVGLLAADDILELLAAGLIDIAMLTRAAPSTGKASGAKRTAQKKTARKPAKRPAKPAKKDTAKKPEPAAEAESG